MKNSATLLLLLVLCITACKKGGTTTQPSVSPKGYTAKMGGMRHWKGIYARRDVALPPPMAVTDSFQLIIINDSTVSVGYSPYIYVNKYLILHYTSANDTDHTISFLQRFDNYGTDDSVAINYYYLRDSIVYTELVTDTTTTLLTSNLFTL